MQCCVCKQFADLFSKRAARFRWPRSVACPTDRRAARLRAESPAALDQRASEILRFGNRLILGSLRLLEGRNATPLHDRSAASVPAEAPSRTPGNPLPDQIGMTDRMVSKRLTG